jgi:hypothetical protein
MALVNPNIAMSYRAPEMPNQLANYAAMQQIQSGQRQAEVSQMQIEQMRRDDATLKQIQAKSMENGGPADLDSIADAYLKSGNAKFVEFGIGLRQKLDEKKQFASIMGSAPRAAAPASEAYPGYNESIGMAAPAPAAAPASEPYPGYNQAIGMTPSVNAMAPAAAPAANALADVAMLRQKRDALLSMGTPQAIAAARALDSDIALASKPPVMQTVSPGGSLVGPSGNVIFTAPAAAAAPPSMVAEYNFAKTADGGGFKGTYQQFVTARAAASRAPAAPRPEQPPVAVVDPVTGKPVYVTREQALSGKMTPASAMEGLPPKEIQAREAKYPAATSAVKAFETSAERLAADLEKLAVHPGLSGISGLIYGRTPAVTKDARAAQALYDGIVARGGFQELQNMRASSPTGGALGNVSNQEGQYLRDAFAPINRTQDTADLSRALTEAAGATRSSKQRLRDAYDMTYDYKNQGKASAPAAAAGAPDIDALLNKYK